MSSAYLGIEPPLLWSGEQSPQMTVLTNSTRIGTLAVWAPWGYGSPGVFRTSSHHQAATRAIHDRGFSFDCNAGSLSLACQYWWLGFTNGFALPDSPLRPFLMFAWILQHSIVKRRIYQGLAIRTLSPVFN